MSRHFTEEEAVLRIGEVCEVSGRAVTILVDKNKISVTCFIREKF